MATDITKTYRAAWLEFNFKQRWNRLHHRVLPGHTDGVVDVGPPGMT